ncbi:hypothetical protein [Hyphomicrobium sp.]|uniref:hypothetical protein n=1 Tax=Hyphomicrobium sp. TaxID=82 RepID=UPI001D440E90|nr:hypothetical protein [Hyphomicrobium sp.]MBY0561433.1 hypothetical protein [Hyphomicrobium sp.]
MPTTQSEPAKIEKSRCDCLKCEMCKLIARHMIDNGLGQSLGEDEYGDTILRIDDADYMANALLPIVVDFLATQDVALAQEFLHAAALGVQEVQALNQPASGERLH